MGPSGPRASHRTEPLSLSTVAEVLQLSDALRDDILPELGVRFEDHEGGSGPPRPCLGPLVRGSGCDGWRRGRTPGWA